VLLFERPLKVGDWIKLGDNEGEVVETNWRAVHLHTKSRDLIIIPNAALAKGSFINFSRPTSIHREVIPLQFSYNDPPNKVKRVIQEVAQQTPGIIEKPNPVVYVYSYGASGINYGAEVFMEGYAPKTRVRNDFQSLVWYAARRHGLTMPYPITTNINLTQEQFEAEERAPLPPSALAAFPRFGLVNGGGKEHPVSKQAVRHFAKGEQIVAEGGVLPGIYLILRGTVSLTVQGAMGKRVEIAQVGRGEFFGERTAITSGVSDMTATALDDLEVLVVDKETLQSLLEQTPPLSREIVGVMEARRQALRSVRGADGPPAPGS